MSNRSFAYQPWVFQPINTMTPAQRQQWFADCFLLTADLETFISAEGAAILVGETHSGKRVALEKLEQVWQERAWVVKYRVAEWQGMMTDVDSPEQHFQQLMILIARELGEWLRERFTANDYALLEQLDEISLEYLLWFLPHYLGQLQSGRAWRRLLFALKKWPAFAEELLPPDDLCNPEAQQEIVGELLELFYGLGFEAMMVIALDEERDGNGQTGFRPLFNNYTLLEQRNFFLRGAVLKSDFDIGSWGVINGRVTVVHLQYTPAQVREIGERHLQVGTDSSVQGEMGLANTAVWQRGWAELEKIHGRVDPAHWLKFVQLLLDYARIEVVDADSLPLKLATEEATATILAHYYQQYVPLRLDRQREMVWRGHEPIELSSTLYAILEALYQLKGFSGHERLQAVAGTSANLHTQIKRLRRKIEPLDNCQVYITNSRESGYLLHGNHTIE